MLNFLHYLAGCEPAGGRGPTVCVAGIEPEFGDLASQGPRHFDYDVHEERKLALDRRAVDNWRLAHAFREPVSPLCDQSVSVCLQRAADSRQSRSSWTCCKTHLCSLSRLCW